MKITIILLALLISSILTVCFYQKKPQTDELPKFEVKMDGPLGSPLEKDEIEKWHENILKTIRSSDFVEDIYFPTTEEDPNSD